MKWKRMMRKPDLFLTLLLCAILVVLLYRMWDARDTRQKEKVKFVLAVEMPEPEASDSCKLCSNTNFCNLQSSR